MTEPSYYRVQLKGWSLLALSALGAAGILALLLALSRTPVIGPLLPWSADFFYRALVTHVMLSFQVWFLTMLAVNFLLAQKLGSWGLILLGLAAAAIIALIVPALLDQGQPLLNNYVPILVHPLFIGALILLAALVAVLAITVIPHLVSSDPAQFGTACTALCYLSACLCFGLAWNDLPPDSALEIATERTVWGGGHVLQLVNSMMLMIAWLRLSHHQWSESFISPALSRAAFIALSVFALSAPLIYGLTDVTDLAHRQIFTRLLWLGIPLPLTLFAGALGWQLWRRPFNRHDPVYLSLLLSLTVFALGGIAGFFLGVGDTRTPSHYHAVIGGVNLGLMGLFPALILPALALKPPKSSSLSKWAFLLYGGGQALHALGFFTAGMAGVPRKTNGLMQGLDSLGKLVSMGLVGLGGAIAVVGGILFIWSSFGALLTRRSSHQPTSITPPIFVSPTCSTRAASVFLILTALFLWQWLSSPLSDLTEPTALDRSGFQEKLIEMISQGDTGERLNDQPLIHPQGPDVYLAFRQWSIEPALILDAGKTYRFHIMSLDVVHSITLLDREILLFPDHDLSLPITTPDGGYIPIQCGEFCGNGHSRMADKIQIKAFPQ